MTCDTIILNRRADPLAAVEIEITECLFPISCTMRTCYPLEV